MAVKSALEKQLQQARESGVNVPDSAVIALKNAAVRWKASVQLLVNSKVPLRRKSRASA